MSSIVFKKKVIALMSIFRSIFFIIFIFLSLKSSKAEENKSEEVLVIARPSSLAGDHFDTSLGASLYTLNSSSILNQPGGDNLPLNQILLQTPGMSEDSFGQLHLRNEHASIQYRINGVTLPEGISLFGQSLSSHITSSITLITGSLPAQFGLTTSGIVDIQTKKSTFKNEGTIGLYGGSHDWIEPSFDWIGSTHRVNYFIAGDYSENSLGIENPTSSSHAIHDRTEQEHFFNFIDYAINDNSKVSSYLGFYQSYFQIPNNPNQNQIYSNDHYKSFQSSSLNQKQNENNEYFVLSYLQATNDDDYQFSVFTRNSNLQYIPDPVGDLLFYGQSEKAKRTNLSEGMQFDGSIYINKDHSFRYGTEILAEQARISTSSEVYNCTNPECSEFSDTQPVTISADNNKIRFIESIYLQDEWHIKSNLTLNFGVRYDLVQGYTDHSQISPRINIVWKWRDNSTFHLGYSRYFTPPPLEDISLHTLTLYKGTTGYPSGYSSANPAMASPSQPERSNYFDIGFDYTFSPEIKVSFDSYYKRAKNLIDEGQFGAPIILSVFNFDKADVYGTELTTSYNHDSFGTYANLAIGRQRAIGIISQQFNFSPSDLNYLSNHYIYTDHNQFYSASGGLSYEFLGTILSSDFIYGSGLRKDLGTIPNGTSLSPYLQINLGANYRIKESLYGPATLGLSLVNVTDRIYQIRSGSGVGVFAPQYGPRRALYASVKYYF